MRREMRDWKGPRYEIFTYAENEYMHASLNASNAAIACYYWRQDRDFLNNFFFSSQQFFFCVSQRFILLNDFSAQ